MPLYDFYCAKCDETFELLVKITSTTPPACPECGGSMEKQLSLTSAPGKSAGILKKARAQAAKEGHFSNYSAAEKKRI